MAPLPPRKDGPPASLMLRLVWFVGLWLAGVAAVGLVSLVIRWALK